MIRRAQFATNNYLRTIITNSPKWLQLMQNGTIHSLHYSAPSELTLQNCQSIPTESHSYWLAPFLSLLIFPRFLGRLNSSEQDPKIDVVLPPLQGLRNSTIRVLGPTRCDSDIICNISCECIDRFKSTTFYLRFCPPSPHSYCSAAGKERTNSLRWACSSARHICSSECTSNGSRFIRRVPENKTGSCEFVINWLRGTCLMKN